MQSTVNFEVMTSSKSEINWKDVTKGKRSRKAVPRIFKGVTKSGNISPKRVDSGSDSDKLAASSAIGQRKSGKSEHVPIKKRRHLLGSRSSSPSAKPNNSLAGVDDLARAVYDKEFNNGTLSKRVKEDSLSWDFSGIEILAAAATMEVCADNPNKVDCEVEDHSIPGSSDASVVVSESKLVLKCNESGNSSSTTTMCADNANCSVLNKCGATSLSPCVSSKVDRRFWDLNTDMEAWVDPYADSNTHVEGLKESSEELPNTAVLGVESFALKQEDKLGDVPDRTSCSKSTSLEECLVKPKKIFNDAGETPNQAIEEDVDVNKSYQVVCGDADAGVETPGQVIRADAILDDVQTTIQGAEMTGTAVSALNIATTYKNEKDSQNSYEPQGNMTSLRKTISTTCKREYDEPDKANFLSSVSKSGCFLASGTITKDEKCVDSNAQSDKTCVTGLMIAESHSQLKQEKLVAKHEDDDLPNEGLGKLEDSCNSYSTRPHGDLAASVGKVDKVMDPCPDSSYEDGELRGSFLYAWEENDLEAELVDYESDGRKEDSSDAADIIGSEVVEGGSEGSHGTEDNGEKKNAVKYPLRRNFMKDDSKNNENCAKKESDGGSGTTVDHSMEMAINENNDLTRRRYLTNRSGMDDCKALMGEYVSRMAREKLQSRTDAVDDKDAFFLPQYRSRNLGDYRDRDVTPEKYVGKYTPASYRGGRDGVNQWNNWGSRSRYTSTYRGIDDFNATRPRRSFTSDSVDKFDGQDFNEQRQTGDYLYGDMRRPVVRTRSPVERDNRLSMGKKMPPARRINSYRSNAHYPQSGDGEPVPNDPAAPVRFSRIPGRERSFSPNPVKDGHMPLNRRSRSRSRTRSPRAWHSYREASFGNRRHNGSPDFRSETRMERAKVPFHKPKFTPEYREGYVSPPRGRFPSQRNSRWVGDRSFGDNHDRSFVDNHFKRRRSPTGGFRFNNQSTNSSGRFKSDEYYRPMNRPRRFPSVDNDDRETKFETMYDDEKLENKGEMHRAKQHEKGGYFKRFQRDVNNDFETRNLNNEEGVRAPVPRDVAQVQGVGDDKKETEILLDDSLS